MRLEQSAGACEAAADWTRASTTPDLLSSENVAHATGRAGVNPCSIDYFLTALLKLGIGQRPTNV